jgi:hypothetical protein
MARSCGAQQQQECYQMDRVKAKNLLRHPQPAETQPTGQLLYSAAGSSHDTLHSLVNINFETVALQIRQFTSRCGHRGILLRLLSQHERCTTGWLPSHLFSPTLLLLSPCFYLRSVRETL